MANDESNLWRADRLRGLVKAEVLVDGDRDVTPRRAVLLAAENIIFFSFSRLQEYWVSIGIACVNVAL